MNMYTKQLGTERTVITTFMVDVTSMISPGFFPSPIYLNSVGCPIETSASGIPHSLMYSGVAIPNRSTAAMSKSCTGPQRRTPTRRGGGEDIA